MPASHSFECSRRNPAYPHQNPSRYHRHQDDANPANVIEQSWEYSVDALDQILVTGQWDFRGGDLSATVGNDLTYFDGEGGTTESQTDFGTTTSFGIPDIDGKPASVMLTPASGGMRTSPS